MLIQYGDVNVQTTVNDLSMKGLQQTDLIFMLFHLWMCNTVIGGSNISSIKTIQTSLGFGIFIFKLVLYYARTALIFKES